MICIPFLERVMFYNFSCSFLVTSQGDTWVCLWQGWGSHFGYCGSPARTLVMVSKLVSPCTTKAIDAFPGYHQVKTQLSKFGVCACCIVCLHTPVSAGIHILVGPKRVSDPFGAGVTGIHQTWMLGPELRSYGRAALFLITDPSLQSPKSYRLVGYHRLLKQTLLIAYCYHSSLTSKVDKKAL